jgi:hypothetical protein
VITGCARIFKALVCNISIHTVGFVVAGSYQPRSFTFISSTIPATYVITPTVTMTEMKADFIKVETPPGKQQTLPVEPGKRIPASDISISMCDIKDVDKIVRFQTLF